VTERPDPGPGGPLLSHAGIASFLRAPVRTLDEVRPEMIAVYGAPTDWTLGTRPGARYGPQAIRQTSTHLAWYLETSEHGEMTDMRSGRVVSLGPREDRLVDLGDVPIYPVDVGRTIESIAAMQAGILERGAFPIMLGGDHLVTYPAVRAYLEHVERRGRRAGFIQFDAHFDLVSDNPIFGPYYHGSVTRRIAELPQIAVPNMAWIGINGYARGEQIAFVQEGGGRVYTRSDVRSRGVAAVVGEALEHALDGCDELYVTIDIDVLDGGQASGAGSINIDGLAAGELLDAVDLLADAPVGALDVVEVAPLLDATEYTARTAAVLLTNFICRRAGAARGGT